jgi:hypothetical protein
VVVRLRSRGDNNIKAAPPAGKTASSNRWSRRYRKSDLVGELFFFVKTELEQAYPLLSDAEFSLLVPFPKMVITTDMCETCLEQAGISSNMVLDIVLVVTENDS